MTEAPEVLYHYTTAKGLMGILESNILWATDLRNMNDFSELTYSMNLIECMLKEAIDSKDNSSFTKYVLSKGDPLLTAKLRFWMRHYLKCSTWLYYP
jgi:hypothetical protein